MSEAATPYVVNQQTGSYSGTPEFLDSPDTASRRYEEQRSSRSRNGIPRKQA